MRRALIGRMGLLPRRVRNVNTTKIPRPSPVLSIALKPSSDFECRGSGRTAIGLRNMSSIAAGETPCFWHLDRLPSSQLNPATCIRVSAVAPLLSVHFCTAIRQYLRLYGFQENERVQRPMATSRDNLPRRDARQAGSRKDFWRCSRDLRHYVHEVACVAGAATVG
jgi:hypothetical protein